MANAIKSMISKENMVGGVYLVSKAERPYMFFERDGRINGMLYSDLPLNFVDFNNLQRARGWLEIPQSFLELANPREIGDFIFAWKNVKKICARNELPNSIGEEFLLKVKKHFGNLNIMDTILEANLENAIFTFLNDENAAMIILQNNNP